MPPSLRPVLRYVVLAALTAAAVTLGYGTLDPRLEVATLWPVYGVGVLWLVTGTPRSRPLDAVALAAVTAVTLGVDDANWQRVTVGAGQTVVAAVVFLLLARALTGNRWSWSQPISLRHVVVLCVAALGSALVTALIRLLGLGLLPPLSLDTAALLVVRNTSGILLTLVPALLVLHRLRSGRPSGFAGNAGRAWVETCVLVVVATWLSLVVFVGAPLPLSFALVLVVVVAAFRVPPLAAVTVALVVGLVAVLATLQDQGTFALEGRPFVGAAIAQGFLITVVVAALAISVGVDERQRAVRRAEETERVAEARAHLLATVVEHLDEGVTVITDDDRYTLRNRAARGLSGRGGFLDPVPGDELQPTMLDEHGAPLARAQMPHARARAGARVVRERVRVALPAGGVRHLQISSIPVPGLGEDGRPLVVNTLRDVTADHEERDQLVGFAGVVAHDLKNPLTVIRGWSESLQEELDGEVPDVVALRSMVGRIVHASDQMRHFIDDLLGITVARDRPLELVDVDLSGLAEELAEQRRAVGPHPVITVQPGMRVRGDRFLLRQLVDNLVGNAVKYVDAGVRPQVGVTAREVDGELEVAVGDNGIGIPPEHRERVFDSFARVGAGDYSGTGLGLAICRRVVERHGGRIWVDPEQAEGTTVRLTLPIPTAFD